MGLAPVRARRAQGSRQTTILLAVLLALCLWGAEANRSPKFPKSLKAKGLKNLQSKEQKVAQDEDVVLFQQTGDDLEEKDSLQSVQYEEIEEPRVKGQSMSNLLSKSKADSEEDAKIGESETSQIFNEILNHPDFNLTLFSEAKKESERNKSRIEPGLNSTILVKARLRPNDVLGKGGKRKDPHAKLLPKGHKHTSKDGTEMRVKRSGILDVVLAHHDLERTDQMVDYWLAFLQLEKVQALKPYIFIYCQNEKYDLNEDDFRPILQLGGEIVHLPNIGRESHAYLEHITKRYNDLANHTLFAQDASFEGLPERFEKLFEPKTGFLPLSLVGHVDCEDPFLPKGVIPQIYAMFANELCPPVGYTSSFEGQFIVSKPRIMKNSWWTYQRLLDLLAADENHWIHAKHDNTHYKDKTNPLFGHVLERTWSVAFDCFESWREGNCWQCIVPQGMEGCGEGDCQCFDKT